MAYIRYRSNMPGSGAAGPWSGAAGPWSGAPTQNSSPTGLLPAAGAYFQSPVRDYYPGQLVAGLNTFQNKGFDDALAYAKSSSAAGAQAQQSYMDSLKFNPYINQVIGDYQNLMNQQFAESQLPALRGSAISAGGLGGSRQALTEALASQRLNQTIGEQTGGLLQTGWNDYVNRLAQAPGVLSGFHDVRSMPAQIMSAWGDVNQRLQQERINAEQGRWNWYRDAPQRRADQYRAALSAGQPYAASSGSTTSSATLPGMSWGQAIGQGLYNSPYISQAFRGMGGAAAPVYNSSPTQSSTGVGLFGASTGQTGPFGY